MRGDFEDDERIGFYIWAIPSGFLLATVVVKTTFHPTSLETWTGVAGLVMLGLMLLGHVRSERKAERGYGDTK